MCKGGGRLGFVVAAASSFPSVFFSSLSLGVEEDDGRELAVAIRVSSTAGLVSSLAGGAWGIAVACFFAVVFYGFDEPLRFLPLEVAGVHGASLFNVFVSVVLADIIEIDDASLLLSSRSRIVSSFSFWSINRMSIWACFCSIRAFRSSNELFMC